MGRVMQGIEFERRLAIVGCGASKLDRPAEARNLYDSTYFEKKREFAESYADYQYVLSAKYGLVAFEDEIEPYDAEIGDLCDVGREHLRHRVRGQLANVDSTMMGHGPYSEIVLLCGREYRELIRPVLHNRGYDESLIWSPFEQDDLGGIGDQMGWLDSQMPRQRLENSSDEEGQTSLSALADGGDIDG